MAASTRGSADQRASAGQVLVGDHFDLDAASGAAADLFLVAAQDSESAAADGTDAEQADLNRLHWNSFLNENAVMKKPSRK